ncbi:hypothetical protein KJ761_00195 [Patescibacteria group bacterium]|nr:hypothetical protein [Patescibacteria group bacterium]
MDTSSMRDIFKKHGIGVEDEIAAAIIASGGGTTAEIYMLGARDRWIPGVRIKLLISTKEGAGCIEKALECGVSSVTVDRKSFFKGQPGQEDFNKKIASILRDYGIELIYLAGCNQEIYPIRGIYIANNHPASKETDGGKGMHDIMVHEHVLLGIKDEISRYPHLINKVHRTRIDHHEAISRKPEEKGMDIGDLLSTTWVDIPRLIVDGLMGGLDVQKMAQNLQRHVMKYEYMSIISAAMADAERVRDAKLYHIQLGGF